MQVQVNWFMLIGSISLLFAAILFFAGFASSLAMAQQTETTTTTTIPGNNTTINITGAGDTTAASGAIQPNVNVVEGAQVTVPAHDVRTASVDCPDGEILTGGGYESSDPNLVINRNRPLDENTWGIAGNNFASLEISMTPYALCIGQPTNVTAPPTGTTGAGDTTAPVLTVPQTMYAIAPEEPIANVITFGVSAQDNVDGSATLDSDGILYQDDIGGDISIECNPPSGSNFPVGNHTVQCSATDAAGNTGTASFIISVSPPDTTGPFQETEPPLLAQEQPPAEEEEQEQQPAEEQQQQTPAEEVGEGGEGAGSLPANNGGGE